jgi:hypothetical protein
MRGSLFVVLAAVVVAGAMWATKAGTFPVASRDTKAACLTCHVNPAGGPGLTDAGTKWKADKTAVDAAAAGAQYVGANKCKSCHMKEYNSWKATPHASALATLSTAPDSLHAKVAAALKVELKGPPAKGPACISCHVTGHGLPGGYAAADTARAASLSGVSCESCHGPGSKHITAPLAQKKSMISGTVSAAMCTQCHTPATSPGFKYEEYKAKGMHVMKSAAPATTN